MTNIKKKPDKLKPGDLCKISVNILYYDNLLNTGVITVTEHKRLISLKALPNNHGIFIGWSTDTIGACEFLVGHKIMTVDTEFFDITKI